MSWCTPGRASLRTSGAVVGASPPPPLWAWGFGTAPWFVGFGIVCVWQFTYVSSGCVHPGRLHLRFAGSPLPLPRLLPCGPCAASFGRGASWGRRCGYVVACPVGPYVLCLKLPLPRSICCCLVCLRTFFASSYGAMNYISERRKLAEMDKPWDQRMRMEDRCRDRCRSVSRPPPPKRWGAPDSPTGRATFLR